MSAPPAAEQECKSDGQHRSLLVTQAMGPAAFRHAKTHCFPEAAQLRLRHLTGGGDLALIRGQLNAQPALPQLPRRVLGEFPKVELFGPVVRLVKILGHSRETRAVTHRLPSRCLIGRASKQLRVNKALHQNNRMSVSSLPVFRKAGQVQSHHFAGQVRILAAVGQHAKSRIVGDQMQPRAPLIAIPADRLIPRSNMIRGRRPPQ